MPAQRRSSPENLDALQHRQKQSRRVIREDSDCDEDDDGDDEYPNDEDYDDEEEMLDVEVEEEEEVEDVYDYDFHDDDDDESDGIPSDIEDEWHTVDLTLVRKDVQCAICLGFIKKARTVMECLHRFCRECINKSMRLGNNECPACRTHCASRRSLRDDPRYDAIIATLYSDIEKYEEEELSLQEEDKTRNKQIQASFAQILQRQSEALYKRSSKGKDSSGTSMRKFPRKYRNAYTKRRRSSRSNGNQDSNDNEDETDHDENKDSASSDEHDTSIKQRKSKRGRRARCSLLSSSAANSDDGGNEDEVEARKEIIRNSSWILWKAEQLSWGAAAARSHTRHGSTSGNKGSNNTRICKLVNHLNNLHQNDPELQVHLLLISLDKQSSSCSQQLHLCCDSSLSVEHLREYVADMSSLQAKDVEMLLVKQMPSDVSELSSSSPSISLEDRASLSQVVGPSMVTFAALKDQVTLDELQASGASLRGNLILAFRQKPER